MVQEPSDEAIPTGTAEGDARCGEAAHAPDGRTPFTFAVSAETAAMMAAAAAEDGLDVDEWTQRTVERIAAELLEQRRQQPAEQP